MSASGTIIRPPVKHLVAHFERYLSYYEAKPPFAKPEQLRTHRKTIDLRRQLGTASAALADDRFLDSLAETLKAWGVGRHDAILAKPPEFRYQLRNQAGEITVLESILTDNADVSTVGRHEWYTSRTKVIDNAIVGFVRSLEDELDKNS